MLLKGHGEVTSAPQPGAAAEMLVIRLAHLANMPTPGEIVRKLTDPGTATPQQMAPATPDASPADPAADPLPAMMAAGHGEPPAPVPSQPVKTPPIATTNGAPEARLAAQPTTLLDISELADTYGEPLLAALIRTHVRLVRMQPGLLEISLTDGAPETLPGDMARLLTRWTDTRWMVSLSDGAGSLTISEERQAARQKQRDDLAETPIIKSIFETFPGAEIESVRPAGQQNGGPSQ